MQDTKESLVQPYHSVLESTYTEKETPTILRSQIKRIIEVALGNNMPGVLVVRELVKLL